MLKGTLKSSRRHLSRQGQLQQGGEEKIQVQACRVVQRQVRGQQHCRTLLVISDAQAEATEPLPLTPQVEEMVTDLTESCQSEVGTWVLPPSCHISMSVLA